jgi:hypothetical protein
METLTIKSPADLLSFIGHTLGFWPQESLVSLTLDTNQIGATLRVDFPRHDGAELTYARTVADYLAPEAYDKEGPRTKSRPASELCSAVVMPFDPMCRQRIRVGQSERSKPNKTLKTDLSVDNVHTSFGPTNGLTGPGTQATGAASQKKTSEKVAPSHVIKTITDHEQVSDQPGRHNQERNA